MKPFLDTFRFRHAALAVLCAFGLLLAGCGGSSSGGGDDGGGGGSGGGGGFEPANYNEEQAVVGSDEDAKTVSKAARESAQQAILEEEQPDSGVPGGVLITTTGDTLPVYDISLELLSAGVMPSGLEYVSEGECGGRAVTNYAEDYSSQYIDYQNYCTSYGGEQYIIDGYFDFDNLGDSSSYQYSFDYVVTYRGETYRSRGTYSCNDNGCSYRNYFVGTDGRQYRTENVSVSGSNGSYSVSARVYDQELGYVDYDASNLILCDSGVGFSSGTITVTASSGTSITVSFSGCDSYTVTYNGTAYPVTY